MRLKACCGITKVIGQIILEIMELYVFKENHCVFCRKEIKATWKCGSMCSSDLQLEKHKVGDFCCARDKNPAVQCERSRGIRCRLKMLYTQLHRFNW